jgi:hypothetical protein
MGPPAIALAYRVVSQPAFPARAAKAQDAPGRPDAVDIANRNEFTMNVPTRQRDSGEHRSLYGKVSVITGSTSGIGLGIARALAAAGSAVILNGFGRAEAKPTETANDHV